MPIRPGQTLKISEKDQDDLGACLFDLIVQRERDHAPLFADMAVWWDWYEAKPRFKRKDFPFKDASNVIVPLIQFQSDQLVNQLYGSIFSAGRRVWNARTENEALIQHTRDVVRFLNWAANDNDFDLKIPLHDMLQEMVVVGSSVIAMNWQTDVRHVVSGQRGEKLQAAPISYGGSPVYEHVPREQILWDTAYSIGNAPDVSREYHYSWSELAALAQENGWYKDAVDFVKDHSGIDGSSKPIRDAKRKLDGLDTELGTEPHSVFEITIDWPVLKQAGFTRDFEVVEPNEQAQDEPLVPLVLVLHRKTGKLLHAKASPYLLPYKPFFDFYFKKRSGRGHSVGLAKKLEHMQIAMTALLNQAIDARTRANGMWARTSKRDLTQQTLDPRRPVHVPEGSTFEPLAFPTNVLQDTSIFNIVNIVSERLTGQADPMFGRESRSGGHPSPATSTLFLAEQAKGMTGTTRDMMRKQISRMGEAAAHMYQQFATDDQAARINRILGDLDGQRVNEFFFPEEPSIGLMEFDVIAMDDKLNPQAELSKQVSLMQINTSYWGFLMQAVQAAQQAVQMGMPQFAQLAFQAMEAQTKFQERVLDAGDVDDFENFVLDFTKAVQAAQGDLQRTSQGLGAMGAAQGGMAQPGVGGPQGANGGRAPRALGAPGIR